MQPEPYLTLAINQPIPTLNKLYRTNKNNIVYKSNDAKNFDTYIKTTYKQDIIYDDKMKLDITFFINRNSDIDARLKVLLDAFEGVIYENDIQIYELCIHKELVKGKANVKTIIMFYKM
jgi:hypothetical protein